MSPYAPTPADRARFAHAEHVIRAIPDLHQLAVLPVGSRATGTATLISDLDVVVILPDAELVTGRGAIYRAVAGIEEASNAGGASNASRNVAVEALVYGEREANKLARLPANPVRHALALAGATPGPVHDADWQTMAQWWIARADGYVRELERVPDEVSDGLVGLWAHNAIWQMLVGTLVAAYDDRRPPRDLVGLARAVGELYGSVPGRYDALDRYGTDSDDDLRTLPPLDREATVAQVRELREWVAQQVGRQAMSID